MSGRVNLNVGPFYTLNVPIVEYLYGGSEDLPTFPEPGGIWYGLGVTRKGADAARVWVHESQPTMVVHRVSWISDTDESVQAAIRSVAPFWFVMLHQKAGRAKKQQG